MIELMFKQLNSLTKLQRNLIFYYIIFNIIGYLSFLLDLHPKIAEPYNEKKYSTIYFITPKKSVISSYESFDDYFWPFHKFSKSSGYADDEGGEWRVKQEYSEYNNSYTFKRVESTKYYEFYGFWGFYDHKEFIVYVILPFLGLLFSLFYKTKVAPNLSPK